MKKGILLFVALVLPVLIFLFLKQFGTNEFAIPVYRPSVDSLNRVCQTSYRDPYLVSDSVLKKLGWKEKPASVVVMDADEAETKELGRMLEQFSADQVQVLEAGQTVGETTFSRWRACVFVAKPVIDYVLVDSQQQIRGYYVAGSRKEMDRLEVELKILLEKY